MVNRYLIDFDIFCCMGLDTDLDIYDKGIYWVKIYLNPITLKIYSDGILWVIAL